MTRIVVVAICEGETERTFIKEVIQPCYQDAEWRTVLPGKTFGNPRGGDVRWGRVKPDLVRMIKQSQSAIVTTLFDFYGLNPDFPSRKNPRKGTPHQIASAIEEGMAEEVQEAMGGKWDSRRFIPYIQMHEFEALLFSDPAGLARGLFRADLETSFQIILDQFEGNPERINDSPHTAPGKRIEQLFSSYSKPLYGNIAALEIGLGLMRDRCAHFADWLMGIDEAIRLMSKGK